MALTIPDKLKLAVNGKHPMLMPTLGANTIDRPSTTTRLNLTADDGSQPPLPAALVGRGRITRQTYDFGRLTNAVGRDKVVAA
ncbi:MAG: hypothetical protein WAK55_00750 [Xanthobacteraceae bacterium]